MRLPQTLDEALVEFLRPSRAIPSRVHDPTRVLSRAELHGVGGLVFEAMTKAGVELDPTARAAFELRATARALDHEAHLRTIGRIDEVLTEKKCPAVALKGPLFAERYHPVPSGRATSDIDLLVAESDLEVALGALATIGYTHEDSPSEHRFRREHHHLHLSSRYGPPLELHFHAYRGFGALLPSEPLVERRERFRDLRTVGVLSRSDELVYLAVHAGAHRFVRLGWLYDVRLLLERMSEHEIEIAALRARGWGYARMLAFTGDLLCDVLGVSESCLAPLGRLGAVRLGVVRRLVGEPSFAFERSLTRFVYSAALCDTVPAAARYAALACAGRARSVFER